MTQLGKVQRKTQLEYKGRVLIVKLFPKYMTVRELGRAKDSGVNVSYDAIYELGMKNRARAEAKEAE